VRSRWRKGCESESTSHQDAGGDGGVAGGGGLARPNHSQIEPERGRGGERVALRADAHRGDKTCDGIASARTARPRPCGGGAAREAAESGGTTVLSAGRTARIGGRVGAVIEQGSASSARHRAEVIRPAAGSDRQSAARLQGIASQEIWHGTEGPSVDQWRTWPCQFSDLS